MSEPVLPDITDPAQVLSANDVKIEAVPCPEWGCTVYVRTMESGGRDQFDLGNINLGKPGEESQFNFANMRARLCALTMCRKDGTLLFTPEQVEALSQKSAVAMDRVYSAARKLNRLNKEDVDFFTVSLKPAPNSESSSISA